MAHKIIMLGGRRSGKSSILASILYALNLKTDGSLFTVVDQTQYSSNVNEAVAVRLSEKRHEINSYLKNMKGMGVNNSFLVDMSPSKGKSVYEIQMKINGASPVTFSFVDVPGEKMEDGKNEEVVAQLKECDVYIIAIDTPYMMQEDDDINEVYNRVEEITSMMTRDEVCGSIYNRKMIIFCPVKCEKWIREGRGEEVAGKVCKAYRTLINTLVNEGSFDFMIMPIQTVGGIEHVKLLDGKRCFKSGNDTIGEKCSVNEITGQVMFKDGKIGDADNYHIEEDPELIINSVRIPLSWYKTNGVGFSPKDSEQPAYHIVKFLVEKEKALVEKQIEENATRSWLAKLIGFFIDPPFGQYLDAYNKVVEQLVSKDMIKVSGDGFKKIVTTIP